jgi:predicted alpha/beta-hydrolase family hydrolase
VSTARFTDDELDELIGSRNELVSLVEEWKRRGWGPGMAVRFKALHERFTGARALPPSFQNRSRRHKQLTGEECQALINGSLLALASKDGGRLTIPVADIYAAAAALGTLAIAISDDDAVVTITGVKHQ